MVDEYRNHRGARMVFLIMNPTDILDELRMFDDHDTFVARVHEDVIDR